MDPVSWYVYREVHLWQTDTCLTPSNSILSKKHDFVELVKLGNMDASLKKTTTPKPFTISARILRGLVPYPTLHLESACVAKMISAFPHYFIICQNVRNPLLGFLPKNNACLTSLMHQGIQSLIKLDIQIELIGSQTTIENSSLCCTVASGEN